MTVKWVQQEEPNGCCIAALAMITGKSYGEVRGQFPNYNNEGLMLGDADQWLIENGYAIARKFKHIVFRSEKRSVWPPEPWADVHLCYVRPTKPVGERHCVVMLRDGTVLDPALPAPQTIAAYHTVYNITAVARV